MSIIEFVFLRSYRFDFFIQGLIYKTKHVLEFYGEKSLIMGMFCESWEFGWSKVRYQ